MLVLRILQYDYFLSFACLYTGFFYDMKLSQQLSTYVIKNAEFRQYVNNKA